MGNIIDIKDVAELKGKSKRVTSDSGCNEPKEEDGLPYEYPFSISEVVTVIPDMPQRVALSLITEDRIRGELFKSFYRLGFTVNYETLLSINVNDITEKVVEMFDEAADDDDTLVAHGLIFNAILDPVDNGQQEGAHPGLEPLPQEFYSQYGVSNMPMVMLPPKPPVVKEDRVYFCVGYIPIYAGTDYSELAHDQLEMVAGVRILHLTMRGRE